MTRYVVTATNNAYESDLGPEILLDKFKNGKMRLNDFFEDVALAIQPVPPVAPDMTKMLKCPKHGEQPYKLVFAPDRYKCPITDCTDFFTFAEVWSGAPIE